MLRLLLISPLCFFSVAISTEWQPGQQISYTGDSPSFTSDNLRMYITVTDGVPTSQNIGYNNWNGSAWIWGGDVIGDIRTGTYNEREPFITYDGQWMYFVRAQVSDVWIQIYKAQNTGDYINFNGSTPLGPQINNIYGNQYADYPSITQDGQKLYFCAGATHWQIHEATWNGADWDNVIILPPEVNGDGTQDRMDVCITPDGSEIYFRLYVSFNDERLAYSRKVGGIWQQWQYCDYNINIPNVSIISNIGITYGNYEQQELYYTRFMQGSGTGYKYHSFRSPIMVQPSSVGNIKALYAK